MDILGHCMEAVNKYVHRKKQFFTPEKFSNLHSTAYIESRRCDMNEILKPQHTFTQVFHIHNTLHLHHEIEQA